MAFDKASACGALKKGWKKRGLGSAAIDGAYAKCMRNYHPPKRHRAKKAK
jgi:hypothetical protein